MNTDPTGHGRMPRLAGAVLALLAVVSLLLPLVPCSAAGNDDVQSFPFMQPDEATLQRWLDSYEAAPRFDFGMTAQATLPGHVDLLQYLDYVPSENNQGGCGNCWAWAGTSALGIALDVQRGVYDRLSVQFINSCEQGVIGKACCQGGWLADFANYYDSTGMCIPWSNQEANWQDASASCTTPCGTISTTPSYKINSAGTLTIPTKSVEGVSNRDAAIRNVKTALAQHRAVWFAFFAPSAGWTQFTSFWSQKGESAVVNLDALCSGITHYAGHAVLCVGYDDTDPNNRYWIMLNSWGTDGGGRPNGLFRVNMDMDYNTRCGIDAFYWQALDVTFGTYAQLGVQPNSLECSVLQYATTQTSFTLSNDGQDDLIYEVNDTDPEASGGELVALAYDDGSAESVHNGNAGARFAVRFTPDACPSILTSASVEFEDTASPWPSGEELQFAIEIYDNDGPGEMPGTLLGGTTAIADATGWQDIDLASLDIATDGDDFYIAFDFLADAPDYVAVGFDESTSSGRSYARESGGQWLPVEETGPAPGNWLIRATTRTQASAWVNSAPASGTVTPGGSQQVTVTVDAATLPAGECEASIRVSSNDAQANPTVLPVTVTVLPAADLVPVILCPTWEDLDAGIYDLTCAVANEAYGPTDACVAQLSVDGDVIPQPVPGLGPGESFTFTYGPVTLSDGSDTVSLNVDTGDDIYWESNEGNNEAEITVAAGAPITLDLLLSPGWNMVSVPLILADPAASSVFPGATAVYTWDSTKKSYVVPPTIAPDTAYWVAVQEETPLSISGAAVTSYLANLTPGWHMLGSVQGATPDLSVPRAAPLEGVLPYAYGWNNGAKAYDSVTELQTGTGYWIAATQQCLLQVS